MNTPGKTKFKKSFEKIWLTSWLKRLCVCVCVCVCVFVQARKLKSLTVGEDTFQLTPGFKQEITIITEFYAEETSFYAAINRGNQTKV